VIAELGNIEEMIIMVWWNHMALR